MSEKPSESIQSSAPERAASDPRRKLGRGLGALMGETRREEPFGRKGAGDSQSGSQGDAGEILRMLPIAAIAPLPGNPRKHFDDDALDELAGSIAKRGVIQPVIVRPKGEGGFELVAGERRWRAAQRARLHEIPALVRELDERDVVAIALIENLQREDLNPIEEARAYHRLSDEEAMTQAEIAAMVQKSRSHVANMQRLLALPPQVLDLVEVGRLTTGHARALIGHDDAVQLAQIAADEGLSVRDVEQLVKPGAEANAGANAGVSAPSSPVGATRAEADPDIVAVERQLAELLGLEVRIKSRGSAQSGTISVRYGTLDQLDLVCQRLTGGQI